MSDVGKWIAQLASSNPDKRYEACEQLRVTQSAPEHALEALDLATNDSDPQVADAARRALTTHTSPTQELAAQSAGSTSIPSRWTVPVIICGLIALCGIPFVACPLLLQAACRPIFIAPNTDPSPLAEAAFNPDPERMEEFLDVSLFETHLVTDRPDAGGVKFFQAELDRWPEGNAPSGINRMAIFITLQASISMARWQFDTLCPANEEPDNYYRVFTSGGTGDDRFCIYFINEMRESPDSGCGATGEYAGHAMFQKGRAVIDLLEYTNDRDSTAMDETIALVAEAVSSRASGR